MPKPVLFTVDDDPEVLRAIERDLRTHYADRYRIMRANSASSAHSTNATKSGGVTNRAFLPSRSASRTARAREHAVQMLSRILLAKVLDMTSDSGGHPTGVTEFISSFFIRFTASPSRNI